MLCDEGKNMLIFEVDPTETTACLITKEKKERYSLMEVFGINST